MTDTVKNHAQDIVKRGSRVGEKSRPYVDSNGTNLLLKEIINSKPPAKDKGLPNGLKWEVPGSVAGRGEGIWELVIDMDTNKIVHFNFVK